MSHGLLEFNVVKSVVQTWRQCRIQANNTYWPMLLWCWYKIYLANTRHSPNVGLMLAQCLRCWPNINPLNSHDASKHHFASLKNDLISLTSSVFTELANTMKYGGGVLYNLVLTEWRHWVSYNEIWGRGFHITLFSPSAVTAFHRISFCHLPPTSSHFHPLHVENWDSNSRLPADEDDTG